MSSGTKRIWGEMQHNSDRETRPESGQGIIRCDKGSIGRMGETGQNPSGLGSYEWSAMHQGVEDTCVIDNQTDCFWQKD